MMKKYRVRLTWKDGGFFSDAVRDWRGIVPAANVDDAIRIAKQMAGAPDRATSETQRVD